MNPGWGALGAFEQIHKNEEPSESCANRFDVLVLLKLPDSAKKTDWLYPLIDWHFSMITMH